MSQRFHAPKCKYEVVDGHIETDGTVINRVSGTSIAGILGCSPWNTPFQVACALLGVCRPDISDKPSVRVGQELEPVVIDYLAKTYAEKGMFLPAEEIFAKREGDHDAWVSDFEDDTFAGHVDGAVLCDDGEYILEIKTSINMDSWANGVPEYYYWQIALYNEFLTQKDMAFVGLGMVNQNTHKDSTSWVPNERTVALFEMPIDREDVRAKMDIIREWYSTYILNNRTPDYDPDNAGDVEMYNHLCNIKRDIGEVQNDLDDVGALLASIQATEDAIADLCSKVEEYKAKLKTYMECNSLSVIESSNGATIATLSSQNRASIDKKLLQADGINPDKYTVTKTTNVFKLKSKE